jgi:hypothetical protein
MRLRIPLSNFDRESSSVLQLPNARIVPVHEIEDLRLDPETKYVLEMDAREGEKPRRSLDRVLAVFKLFKDCLVLSNVVYMGRDKFDSLPHYTHWIDKDRGVPLYYLSQEEEIEFCAFWDDFFEINAGNFAVSRFHLADYRANSADRFVDYVESLEYLFVPDSGESEIAYKFRQRGCMILGLNGTPEKRKGILDALKDAYRLRSTIVHGGDFGKYIKGKKWEDKLSPIRNYAREAIRFFFRQGCLDDAKKRKELLERLLILEARVEV